MRRRKKIVLKLILIVAVSIFVFLIAPVFLIPGASSIYSNVDDVANHYDVAIVFGAGLNDSGRPSDVLSDRLTVAADLYFSGKVDKILVSGDNSLEDYDEPTAMFDYLVKWGVPADDIAVDYAGRRTYDTCARASEIWGIDNALLVSQEFHLPRAIFLCRHFGIESMGVSASLQPYVLGAYFQFREKLATYKAIIDVYLLRPYYIGGEVEEL